MRIDRLVTTAVAVLTAVGALYPLEAARHREADARAANVELVAVPQSGGAAQPRAPARPPRQRVTADSLLDAFLGGPFPTPRAAAERPYLLRTLVATLPDPVDSRLDWAYDAGLEALWRGAERTGYVIDRFWLPWQMTRDTTVTSLRGRRPGVLLFRGVGERDHQLLLVYVVGEVPTAGVAKQALVAALDEIARVEATTRAGAGLVQRDTADAARTLTLVAPFFSGSATSLRLALDRWLATHDCTAVAVVTGAATSDRVADLLGDATPIPCADSLPRIGFRRTINTTPAQTGALFRVLKAMGVPTKRMAVLREQTTQFGHDFAANRRQTESDLLPIVIPFPLNVSSLRSEYARVLPGGTATEADTGARRGQLVRVDLRDSVRPMENSAAMSRDLTPAAVELVIDDIARTLAAHRVQAALILATDVRDQIFLATELRRRMRDVQLLFYGGHALLARADRNVWLRGSLVATSYPLFFENQFWDPARPDRVRNGFTSDVAEGVYNATLFALGETALAADYGFPFEPDSTHPPVWVTVVGGNGVYPLRIASGGLAALRPKPPGAAPTADHSPADEKLLLLVLIAGGELVAWLGMRDPGGVRAEEVRGCLPPGTKQALDTLLAPVPPGTDPPRVTRDPRLTRFVHGVSLLLHRELYLATRFLALGGMIVPLGLVTLHHWPLASGDGRDIPLWLLVAGGALVAAVGLLGIWQCTGRAASLLWKTGRYGAVYATRGVGRDVRQHEWAALGHRAAWWFEIAARLSVAVIGVAYAWLIVRFVYDVAALKDRATQAAFMERLSAVDSGVSPAIPLALVGLMYLAWCTANLRRVALLAETSAFERAQLDGPAVAPGGDLARARWGTRLATAVDATRERLFRLVPTGANAGVLLAALAFAWWLSLHFIGSLESAVMAEAPRPLAFDLLLRGGVLAAIFVTVFALTRFLSVWRALQASLRRIADVPVGDALGTLPPPVARLARLSVFDSPSHTLLDMAVA